MFGVQGSTAFLLDRLAFESQLRVVTVFLTRSADALGKALDHWRNLRRCS
jgi:hypothetical protein